MNILYLGDDNLKSTSLHRANALKRLGHNVTHYNPKLILNQHTDNLFLSKLHYHSGYILIQRSIKKWLQTQINQCNQADLIWVDSGEYFGKACLNLLKEMQIPIVLYNLDDPTGNRDSYRFYSLLNAISLYDLIAVVRNETKDECIRIGAKKVIKVWRSYDEIMHMPYSLFDEIPCHFRSEVAFVGTWMRHEQRDEFLLKLAESGINLSVWGDHWQKSPFWNQIKPFYKGKALNGREYVAAIQGAKISIGMLSKGNRDLHTQRSFEIPFIGGVFCAERTSEHTEMYKEDKEAVFWSNAEECIKICKDLLANDEKRNSIRLAGMKRVRKMKVGNEDILTDIINTVFK